MNTCRHTYVRTQMHKHIPKKHKTHDMQTHRTCKHTEHTNTQNMQTHRTYKHTEHANIHKMQALTMPPLQGPLSHIIGTISTRFGILWGLLFGVAFLGTISVVEGKGMTSGARVVVVDVCMFQVIVLDFF